MDLSGTLFCTLCQDSIDLAQKKTELPCNHTFHTQCFLIYVSRAPLQCNLCRNPLITEEVEDIGRVQYREREQERREEIYAQLMAIPGFLGDLKKIKKQIATVRKARSKFFKIGSSAKRHFATETLAMRGILQRMIFEKKKALLESEECANLRYEGKIYTRALREFNTKYEPHTINEITSIPQFKIKRDAGDYWFSRFPKWRMRGWFSLKLW